MAQPGDVIGAVKAPHTEYTGLLCFLLSLPQLARSHFVGAVLPVRHAHGMHAIARVNKARAPFALPPLFVEDTRETVAVLNVPKDASTVMSLAHTSGRLAPEGYIRTCNHHPLARCRRYTFDEALHDYRSFALAA